MGIWKGWLGQIEVGWKSPVQGPVHPQFVALSEPSGLGWLDGFDELLVRCGLVSNGAPDFDPKTGRLLYPLHGKIANKPAHFVEVAIDGDTGEISVTGIVDEIRFHFEKLRLKTTIKTKVNEKGFRIHDEVTNLGGDTSGMELLYHVNFSQPILDAGAHVVAPVKTVVPRDPRAAENATAWNSYPAEQRGYAEQVYFFELNGDEQGNTQVMLKNAHSMHAVTMKYPLKQLPCFTLWKDTMHSKDGYVTGLEPGTNFPNPRSFEAAQGRVVKLDPGESRRFDLTLEVHPDAESVSAAEKAIAKIQGSVKPKSFDTPQKGWSPM
jgi:galactose mutarotase-like enzyme